MLHECMQAAEWAILSFFVLHAALDCACTLCCLFPHRFPNSSYLGMLYVSVFRDTINCENATLARAMVYWAASMSLVRVIAVYFRSPELYLAVAVFYFLEGLVAEYEGFSAGTIKRRTARLVSLFSFGFAVLVLVVMCIGKAVLAF
jgi:hypothetical protein